MYPYKSQTTHEILEKWNEISAAELTGQNRPLPDFFRPEHPHGRQMPRPPFHNEPPVAPVKAPSFRPPWKEPRREFGLRRTETSVLKRCESGLAFLWLRGGKRHWMFITYVAPSNVYGYVWTAMGWNYSGFDASIIEAFYCA